MVDLDAASSLVGGADLVSVMTANNEVGTVQPVAAVAALARDAAPDAVVHTDAVAAAPWLDLAVAAEGADLVSVCAHKLGGPVGVGALCVRREVALAPLVVGGGQERGRRAGTPDVAAAVGLACALRLAVTGRDAATALTAARRDQLAKLVAAGLDDVRPTVLAAAVLPGTCHLLVGRGGERGARLPVRRGRTVRLGRVELRERGGAVEPRARRDGRVPDDARGSLRLTLGTETTDEDVERAAAIVVDAVRRLRGTPT